MSVEPGIVDANILVYALDADAPQHVACRTLLEAAQGEASVTLYVTPQILCEFYAIVTNARRVLKPRSSADALAAISNMLGFLRVLPIPVTGGEVFDLQIVATMKLSGISRIYTFNTDDFKPFSEIEPLTP